MDPLDQSSRGALLEVLGHRHERHTPAAEQGTNGDMVLEVARQAIDLVDHHGVDVAVLGDAGQHGLKLAAVGGAGRLAPVGVFVDQFPTLVAHVAGAGLALRRDGEPLFTEPILGLLFGRDAQVDHTTHRRPPFFGAGGR
ncbi:MAG TPA: hypothetical protein VMU64_00305 [Acidimicrobiales bacterium]|nr:hypothetical protein [Acidimicrobiales bacterium]